MQFSEESKDFPVFVCVSCILEVYDAFEFRQSFWLAELAHFQPKRKDFSKARSAAEHNSALNSFNVCRSCLTPHSPSSLTLSAFTKKHQNDVELIKMLDKLTNLKVSDRNQQNVHLSDLKQIFQMADDRGMFGVRLCFNCIVKLEKSFEVRKALRNAERSHFGLCRFLKNFLMKIQREAPEEEPIDTIQEEISEAMNQPEISDEKYDVEYDIEQNVDADNEIKHFHPDDNESNKENEALLHCNVKGCSRTFKSMSRLSRHKNVHSGNMSHSLEETSCN